MRRRRLLAVLLLLTVARGAEAADWPVFRGPESNNAYSGDTLLGEVEDLGLKLVWKRPLGSGYSSVSIASGRAVVLFSDGTDDVAAAFDARTGEELWRHPIAPTYRGHDGSHDGPISTPLIVEGRVFVLAPLGHFLALDLETGVELWSTHLVQDHGTMPPLYGFGTSPLAMDGVVVVSSGSQAGPPGSPPGEGPTVLGFDPAGGEVLWQAGQASLNYQSPMLVTLGGQRLVLAPTDLFLLGLVAKSGEILWQIPHDGEFYPGPGTAAMNPVPLGNGRFFISDSHDSSSVVRLEPNKDGEMALNQIWSSRSIRNSYAVPVYHDGHLYAYSSRFLTCVDATTGESRWRSRQPGDGFPILVDGHLAILTKKGTLHIAPADPEGYHEMASLDLLETSWTPASYSDGRFYVRGFDAMAAVELRESAASTTKTAETAELSAEGRFAAFLAEAEAAADKAAVVDRFFDAQESFPLVEGDIVHFLYRGTAQDMAVAGDMIGDRTEESMTRLPGTDLFYYSTRLLSDARVSYHFIKDFEERLTDPRNPRKLPDLTGEVSWVGMPEWQSPAHLAEAPVERRGRIESLEVETDHFDARRKVDVYLPAGYDEDADRRYPVVYVHGGNQALKLGGWARTLDNLVGKSVTPLIVAFIDTRDPKAEFFFFSKRDAYAAMFATEVVPAIDESFRTLGTVESRASVGAGLAGYAALYGVFKYPGLVGKVAAQSTFLITRQKTVLTQIVGTAAEQPPAIFLEWGIYDSRAPQESWDVREENRELAEVLRERGYEVTASEVPDGHGWSSWRNRNDKVLRWLFSSSQ